MKLLLIALATLAATEASASVYKLVNHIQFGDKKYSNSLIIEQDKPGQISSVGEGNKDGYRMEVVATPIHEGKKAIHLKYNLFQIENGKDKSFGNPEIVVLPGMEGSIEVRGKNNLPEFKLAVVIEQVFQKK